MKAAAALVCPRPPMRPRRIDRRGAGRAGAELPGRPGEDRRRHRSGRQPRRDLPGGRRPAGAAVGTAGGRAQPAGRGRRHRHPRRRQRGAGRRHALFCAGLELRRAARAAGHLPVRRRPRFRADRLCRRASDGGRREPRARRGHAARADRARQAPAGRAQHRRRQPRQRAPPHRRTAAQHHRHRRDLGELSGRAAGHGRHPRRPRARDRRRGVRAGGLDPRRIDQAARGRLRAAPGRLSRPADRGRDAAGLRGDGLVRAAGAAEDTGGNRAQGQRRSAHGADPARACAALPGARHLSAADVARGAHDASSPSSSSSGSR